MSTGLEFNRERALEIIKEIFGGFMYQNSTSMLITIC